MKIFLLLDPPTATVQERQVAIVHGRPVFYQPEKLKEAKKNTAAPFEAFQA